MVSVNIRRASVMKVLAHFGKSIPSIFIYLSPTQCVYVRKVLSMTDKKSLWLDIGSSGRNLYDVKELGKDELTRTARFRSHAEVYYYLARETR